MAGPIQKSSTSARASGRLHRSTLLVMLLSAGILLFVNLPGARGGWGRLHGWPFAYLYREVNVPFSPGAYCTIHMPSNWGLTDHVQTFRINYLVANIAIASLILIFVGGMVEWWRRRQGPRLQVSLRMLLIAFIPCAIPLAWVQHRISQWQSQQVVVERLKEHSVSVSYRSILPECIESLLSDDLEAPLNDVVAASFSLSAPVSEKALIDLGCFPKLTDIQMDFTEVMDADLRHIGKLEQLERLSMRHTRIQGEGFVHLRNLRRLKYLDVDHFGPGIEALQHLEQLNVNHKFANLNAELRKKLSLPVHPWEFIDWPWLEAIGVLMLGIDCRISEQALEKVRTVQVTCDIKKGDNLKQALDQLFAPYQLRYAVSRGALLVVTEQEYKQVEKVGCVPLRELEPEQGYRPGTVSWGPPRSTDGQTTSFSR